MIKQQYKTVLLDPPWCECGGGKIKRGADRHYSLMTTAEIFSYCKKIVVPQLAFDCHLYLWVTNNFLEEGIRLLNEMGFRYITTLVWVKDKFGLGQYFRGQHELVLFGVRGDFYSGSRKESTLIKGLRRKHSEKPHHLYTKIEAVSKPPRLEVFGRHGREGWDVMGDQAPTWKQAILDLLLEVAE